MPGNLALRQIFAGIERFNTAVADFYTRYTQKANQNATIPKTLL